MNKFKQYLFVMILLLFSAFIKIDSVTAAIYLDTVNANTDVTISIVESSEAEIENNIENSGYLPESHFPQTGERPTNVWLNILIGSYLCLLGLYIHSKFKYKKINRSDKLMKTKLLSTIIVTTMGISTLGTIVHAAEYPNELTGISDVNVNIEIGDDGGPSIPPVDPEEPVDPDPGNPNNGPLAIRYVSDLVFPTLSASTESTVVYANPDSNEAGETFANMVTIQDFRNNATRDGWELTVKQDASTDFISGSVITMTPFIHPTIAAEYEIQTPSASGLRLNSGEQVFARTESQENPSGIVSMGFANPETNGVELSVPANTPVGEYKTTIIWNLASAPLDDN